MYLPIILFLVFRCGLFLERRVEETPLATHRSRGEGGVIQIQMLRPWYVGELGKQTKHINSWQIKSMRKKPSWGGDKDVWRRKTDLIYSWGREWQWLCGRLLGRIWDIFQEGGAGPIAQRRRFSPISSPPSPSGGLGGFWWADRSQGGDTAQTKWSTVLITTRDGSRGVNCVAHWTVNCPLLQEGGVARLVVPGRRCCLWQVETGHFAPCNRVLQSKTHLQ